MLPYDIARCMGVGVTEDGVRHWREGCEDCMRRTEKGREDYQVYMSPPPIIAFECEFRIEPK